MFTVLTDDLISGGHFTLKYQQGHFIYLTHSRWPYYQYYASHTFTSGLSTGTNWLQLGADWFKKSTENPGDIHPVKSHSQVPMNAEELEIMRLNQKRAFSAVMLLFSALSRSTHGNQ